MAPKPAVVMSDTGGADVPREPGEAEWPMVHAGVKGERSVGAGAIRLFTNTQIVHRVKPILTLAGGWVGLASIPSYSTEKNYI